MGSFGANQLPHKMPSSFGTPENFLARGSGGAIPPPLFGKAQPQLWPNRWIDGQQQIGTGAGEAHSPRREAGEGPTDRRPRLQVGFSRLVPQPTHIRLFPSVRKAGRRETEGLVRKRAGGREKKGDGSWKSGKERGQDKKIKRR